MATLKQEYKVRETTKIVMKALENPLNWKPSPTRISKELKIPLTTVHDHLKYIFLLYSVKEVKLRGKKLKELESLR